MPDEVIPVTQKTGDTCDLWDCGDTKSPFWCDHVRAPGEPGICIATHSLCALDIGQGCGMWMQAIQSTLETRRKNLWKPSS